MSLENTAVSATQDSESRQAFYRCALAALRFVERRRPTGRRFGSDADALWRTFHGHLTTADRLELLLRDADAEWPGAFGARLAFNLRATAEDEPFGTDWTRLDPLQAEELWRTEDDDGDDPLDACARAWGREPSPPELTPPQANDRFAVAGTGAVLALARAFAGNEALSWTDQILVVASQPAERQLALLAAVVLNARTVGRVVEDPRDEGVEPGGWTVLVSDDAAPQDAERARQLA